MSNYPPYQFQPYQPPFGAYMPPQPFQPRPDMQGPAPMPQPQTAPQSQQGSIMGLSPASRPVTSREEAMGVAADFSGAPMVFPDVTNNRVYIKRWDIASGGPAFQEYTPVLPSPQKTETPATPDVTWASTQEVQELRDLVGKLQAEIDRLKRPAARGGKTNDADK